MRACLAKLGLRVSQENQAVPSLSSLHISSAIPSEVGEVVSALAGDVTREDDKEYIKGENDTFQLERPDAWSMASVAKALPEAVKNVLPGAASEATTSEHVNTETSEEDSAAKSDEGIIDYDKVVKRLVAHESSLPEAKHTPYFNHHAFFANLKHYNSASRNATSAFGKMILYGEVVTSTNTLLEK